MKIIIDARFWGPAHTGLGVYTKNLVLKLSKLDYKNSYVLIVNETPKETLPTNFSAKKVSIPAYSLKEQLVLPLILYWLHPDLVHFPSINVPVLYFGRYVVTIHDLIKHYSRGAQTSTHSPLFYWPKFFCYLLVFNWIVFFSKKIIVPSFSVKNDLLKRFKISGSKVSVTYEAPVLLKPENKSEKSFDLPEKYAIYTGNAYPHKNLHNLILAWRIVFERTGTVLFLSSGRSVFSQKIEDLIAKENASGYVQYLGFVNDLDLAVLYDHAVVYVFPSFLEGFGLPGLDAMKFELPVVCSNIEALREIYGEAAFYFDPNSVFDIASKIIQTIEDEKLRDRLIKEGTRVVKKYSWVKMAKDSLQIYESCLRL